MENLRSKQQTESKDFKKHANELTYQVVMNFRNAKQDMTHAHSLEFHNFQFHNVDRDIVVEKRRATCQSTFRGSQKLVEAVERNRQE